jgi:hypothetical protein
MAGTQPQQLPIWAFEASYTQPLPQHINFTPSDFTHLANWAAALTPVASSQVQPVPIIATYKGQKDKQAEIQSSSTEAEQDAAKAGATLSSAKPKWPTGRPVVGVVTSPMSSAVAHQAGQNDWHTVAMAREGNTIWVHDPQYTAADYPPHQRRRVALVPGNKMVKALIDEWPGVTGVWFQGPPSTFSMGQQQCMGRSALWVEHTLHGTSPWPPNSPDGGTWTFHHKN